MKKQYLEAGQIVNTHGIRGEVKIQPWSNTPEVICSLERIYIDGVPVKIRGAKVGKGMPILALEGIDTVEKAVLIKNKIIYLDRDDVKLEAGEHFLQDLIGLKVIDAETGAELGILNDIIPMPGNDIYEVKGKREILIPAVPEFIIDTDVEAGIIKVHLIEGM